MSIRSLGRSGAAAAGAIILAAGCAVAQPANDVCANAEVVSVGVWGLTTVSGTTVAATVDGTTGNCGTSNSTPDVWYRVVAPANGLLTASTCGGASYNTVVSIRTACPGAGTQLSCNDNFCVSQSRTEAIVTAGTTYWIRVSGNNLATGTFTLAVGHEGSPVPQIGPDVTVSNIPDVLRHGTSADGTITAYSVGTTSCNPGDYPCLWIDNSNYTPDYDVTRHPVISQNMYRLKSYGAYSRFEHLGQSWLKHGFVSTNSAGCGICEPSYVWRPSLQNYQSIGGDAIGVNCSDTYGASLNGSFTYLGAKNIVNPALGTSPFVRNNGTGDATAKMRLQVPTADVTGQPAGTRFYVEGYYVTADDAQFVRPGQTVAFNALNNASWRELLASTINSSPPSFAATTVQQQPGIYAWKAADASVTLVTADHDDTLNPSTGFRDAAGNPAFPGTFIRSRFWIAAKATSLGGGLYRYEYAVYNHNSDRAAGAFTLPMPQGADVTSVTFHAPMWHSGEPYSNAPWTMSRSGDEMTFASETYAANQNANALRWACLYNFGFTANVAPTTGSATIGLFKPGTIPSIAAAGLPVPTVPTCGSCDFNDDGGADNGDVTELANAIASGSAAPCQDFNNDGGADNGDVTDLADSIASGTCP